MKKFREWLGGLIFMAGCFGYLLFFFLFIRDVIRYLQTGQEGFLEMFDLLGLPAEHSNTTWVGFWNIIYEPLTWPACLFVGIVSTLMAYGATLIDDSIFI